MVTTETLARPSDGFRIEEVCFFQSTEIYYRFLNWVVGEFDLFLKNEESSALTVYFPSGWLSISCHQDLGSQFRFVIQVEGKSKKACYRMMKDVKRIYKRVCAINK